MSALTKKLEEREAKLQHDMKEILNEDGTISAENREKFDRMTGELHGLEASLRDAKDAELEELRAAVADFEKRGGAGTHEKDAEREFRANLRAFLHGSVEERAAIQAGVDANGGFIVPENEHAKMLDLVRTESPILGLATSFTLTGSKSIELPRKATHGAVKAVGETDKRPATDTPTFANETLTCHELYTNQPITQEFLDTIADGESWIMDEIYTDFAKAFGSQLVIGKGDSSKEAVGLFTADTFYTKKTAAGAKAFDAADIIDLYFSLHPSYRANGTFLVSTDAMRALRGMTDPAAAGTIPFVTMTNGKPSVMGRAVEECADAPAIGAGAIPVAFGDIRRAYAVATHKTPVILRDPYTDKPNVSFYGYCRMGGRPWDPNACLLLSTKA